MADWAVNESDLRYGTWMVKKLSKGTRVCYSEEGLNVLRPRDGQRVGTVVKAPDADSDLVAVRWDGHKSTWSYHQSFIALKAGRAR
jgi:hypothetical protein